MSPCKTLASCTLLFCALALSTFTQADTFIEENGVVMMEAESTPARGAWRQQRSIGGFSGNGYHVWTGPDLFNPSLAGRDTLTYRFRIQQAGNYQLVWRSRITKGDLNSEHNDSWVRFPSGRNIPGQHGINGWTKVFMNTLNQWTWRSATVDFVGRPIRQFFSAGDHTLEISGRSNGHAIDRIAIYRYDDVDFSASRFSSLNNSRTVGNASPSQPEPEPESAPQPLPAPEPEPQPQPVAARTEAPSVTVNGQTLQWPMVSSVSINVHRGDGQWLESLPGNSTQWQAPGAGSYYLVATNNEQWPNWGRSDTVEVANTTTEPMPDGSNSMALNLTAQVYSNSAVEIFWISDDSSSLSFEIRRNDELLTISAGRSFFDSNLQPGTNYEYSVSAVNTAGDVALQQSVTARTLGESSSGQSTGNPASTASEVKLTGQVYSQSAIELFWDASALPANTSFQFEVYRNGVQVQKGDEGSYFTDDLTVDTSYIFSVKAVDAAGNAYDSPELTLSTFAADTP